MTSRPDILLLGGTTHRNRGDLAMHQGRLRWLEQKLPTARPIFLANNPGPTREVLKVASELSPDQSLAQPWTRETPHSTRQRLETLWRGLKFARHPGEFGTRLKTARAVLVPGSGSMNSLWWHDWLYVKAAEVRCARRAGVPVVMTSQGIGPAFTHWLDRWVAARMFNACGCVGVRDGEQSMILLKSLGVAESRQLQTGDDALLVPPDPFPAARILAAVPVDRVRIGLNVRDSHTYGRGYAKPLPQVWAAALDELVAKGVNAHFVFIPISYDAQDDDRAAARKVADLMTARDRVTLIEEELDAAALRGLAAAMFVGAGISYHFLLFCLAAGVPALGCWQNPYYQQKQAGLFRLFDQAEAAVSLASLDATGLCGRLRHLIQHRKPLSQALTDTGLAQAARREKVDARILQILEEGA